MLTREGIEARIPHAGAMCLLDAVDRWDATHIVCLAAAPAAGHPLAGPNDVPAIAAVEYAAQAAAVHGALLDGAEAPRAGMLAKLADVDLAADGFDAAGGGLTVHAELLGRLQTGCMYRFDVRNERRCIARGRLTVAFAA